jgi:hypothetical protein
LMFLTVTAIIFFRCETSEDLSPIASNTSKPLFFMLFDVNNDNGARTVDVEFCTNSMAVIPAITVNSETLKTSIDFQEGMIRGELRGLQYKNGYNYKISANRQKTVGEITMPACPNNVKCNSTLLKETQYNLLSDCDSMKFSWACDSYDYFCYEWINDNNSKEATTKKTGIAFTNDGSVYHNLHLLAVKGVCPDPSTSPNVKGDCGDGFVLGLSEELDFDIWIGGALVMKVNQHNLWIKDRIKTKFFNVKR